MQKPRPSAAPPGSQDSLAPFAARDLPTVAAALLLALAGVAAVWWWRGGAAGRLVPIERAPRHEAELRIDVNRADWPELTLLPEVGETMARRIVESRQASGPFRKADDLLRVRGIGPTTLDRIRPYLAPFPDEGPASGSAPPRDASDPR